MVVGDGVGFGEFIAGFWCGKASASKNAKSFRYTFFGDRFAALQSFEVLMVGEFSATATLTNSFKVTPSCTQISATLTRTESGR